MVAAAAGWEGDSEMSQLQKWIVGIGGLDLLISAAGIIFADSTNNDAWRSGAAVAIGMFTFFGFLVAGERVGGSLTIAEDGVRHAITAAVLATYLNIVTSVAFFKPVLAETQLPEITRTMLTSFTTIVGIVIPFYFGSSAYQRVRRRVEPTENTEA
jgi:hypothetical protein